MEGSAVIVKILVVEQFAQLVLRNLQIVCQSADWHAFCGSSVCATQSADCANSQIARNIYIITITFIWHAFWGSLVCASQSADCANSQIARNIYIITITFIHILKERICRDHNDKRVYRTSVLPRIFRVVVGFYIAFSAFYPVYT